LKLNYDALLSTVALNFKLRHYNPVPELLTEEELQGHSSDVQHTEAGAYSRPLFSST
jgi:hypothetical protein